MHTAEFVHPRRYVYKTHLFLKWSNSNIILSSHSHYSAAFIVQKQFIADEYLLYATWHSKKILNRSHE